MKQELLKKINPIIENFVDDVLKSFDDIEKIRLEITQKEALYQDLILQKEKELIEIRIRKATEKENVDRKITEHEEAAVEYRRKAKTYEDLTDELDRKRKNTQDELAKSEIELVRAKDIRIQAEREKANAGKLRIDYELKLESLRIDFEKSKKEKEYIKSENVKNSARENETFKTETRQNEIRKELNETEIRIKSERKKVDRLIERYKLKQSLKE